MAEIVQQDTIEKKKCVTKKYNRMAFRPTEAEMILINDLKNAWQLPTTSDVLHKILAAFHGVAEQRKEALSEIKQIMSKWQVEIWEIHKK